MPSWAFTPFVSRLDVGTSSGLIESISFRRWPDHDQTLIDCGRAMSRCQNVPKISKNPETAVRCRRALPHRAASRGSCMDPVSSADVFLFERFRFDQRGGGLFDIDGTQVAVGSRALDVLGVLIERAGELVSKDEIMDVVWPGTTVEEANLTVQISALRRVLDNRGSERSTIQTVPGRGYRFVGNHPAQ